MTARRAARTQSPLRFRVRSSVVGVLLAMAAWPAHAQPREPQRLSNWLLENDASGSRYLSGLSWRVPEERPAQLALKLELLQALAVPQSVGLSLSQGAGLAARITAMQVTGRVPIAVADHRWLEANPARDPLLLRGHTVDLPPRPRTVSVLTPGGISCRVDHVPGREASAYIRACGELNGTPADWAWVAQPDGRVERYGIALWNETAQDPPAPGAWIWAPPRNAQVPQRFSEQLIRFLSSQGPAPDGNEPSPVSFKAGTSTPSGVGGGMATGLRWAAVADALVDPIQTEVVTVEPARNVADAGMPVARARDLVVTAGDWGSVGVLQTPSARMRGAGSLVLHVSNVNPYTRTNVMVQPFSWMEAGFRYTDVSNRPYGAANVNRDQSYKDKGFDVKFSLWPEQAYRPEVALGFVDVAGTGLFSSEYLVGNKRFGDVDASLGLAWGNLAGVSRTFANGSPGGEFNVSNYFSGRAAFFAGLQWTMPWAPAVLKAEYDSNSYRNEPLGNRFEQKSKFNFGVTYRQNSWLDWTVAFERGNQLSLGLTVHTDLSKLSTPKLSDPQRVPVQTVRPVLAPDWNRTARDLGEQTGWRVGRISAGSGEVAVTVDEPRGVYWQDRVDRAASVLHRDAPQDVDRFVLRYRTRGMELAEQVVDRDEWVSARTQPLPPSQQRDTALPRVPVPSPSTTGAAPQFEATSAPWSSNFRIGYAQNIGGPDNFVLYQIFAEQSAQLQLGRPDLWLSGTAQLRLIDNYDSFRYTAPSNLPRVRTFLREYLTTSDFTLSNLQVTHARALGRNQYVSAYAGYLEEMFAGVGGEWLYRPFASRVALGIDANYVAQRDFKQNLEMRSPAYKVATGHATLYWDTGWNGVELRGSAGRYLAGDLGITAEASRRFRNGVVFGAFATKTNVSAQQFGEGSFDKGVYISIPFDAMFTRSTGAVANFDWKPLTRDGGAKLWRRERLYDITRTRDLRTFETTAAPLPNETVMPADHQPRWQPAAEGPAVFTTLTPQANAGAWRADGDSNYRLVDALHRQGFRNISAEFDQAHRLNLRVAHDSMTPPSRAVGRAARTALNLAPADVREVRILFAERVEPLVEYEFFDLKRLGQHFAGELPAAALQDVVAVRYINPGVRETDPLKGLADTSVVTQIPALNDVKSLAYYPSRVISDFGAAATEAQKVNWLGFAGVSLAAVAGSSVLDSKGLSFAKEHAKSAWLKGLNRVGDAVPVVGFLGAGLLALDGSDPRRSRTGYAAVEAGTTAMVAATGLKYVFGRPRPNAKESKYSLHPLSSGYDSMPSRTTALAWAVATPFALEYRAPWLYGVAGLTNLARIGKQKHWVSDTVAGSLLGYGIGRLFWESGRANSALPQVFVDPEGVNFSWSFY